MLKMNEKKMFMKYVFEKHLCLKTRSQISMVKPTKKKEINTKS